MRKIIVLAGLLGAAALFTGSPAQAWVGCECVKIGGPSMCVPGPLECGAMGGICLAPCDYKAGMKMHHHRHHMHHMIKEEENVSRRHSLAPRPRLAAGPFVCGHPRLDAPPCITH